MQRQRHGRKLAGDIEEGVPPVKRSVSVQEFRPTCANLSSRGSELNLSSLAVAAASKEDYGSTHLPCGSTEDKDRSEPKVRAQIVRAINVSIFVNFCLFGGKL